MTNFVRTDQTRSQCTESASLKEAQCKSDADCQNRPFIPNMNGRWTGQCIRWPDVQIFNGTENITKQFSGICEMEGTRPLFFFSRNNLVTHFSLSVGWCPAERDAPEMLVDGILNFTIFVKNFIEFAAFNVTHKNMVDNLKPCIYHPVNQMDCPIFSLSYIMEEAERNTTERRLMLKYGGVIRVKIAWDCNLDRNIKLCQPVYSFARLDVPFREKPFSIGFNFRFASHWKQNQTHFRTLTKAYGLRLIIDVSGQAGKFHFITLSLNIGSLVGIFGLATFFCDLVLLHLSKKSRTYRSHVFETVHLRTRMQSMLQHNPGSVLFKSEEGSYRSDSNAATTASLSSTSYGTPPTTRQQGKTVAERPLTLINPNRLVSSKSV